MKQLAEHIIESLKINSKSKVNIKDLENWTILDAEDGDIIHWNDSDLFFMYKCLNEGKKYSQASENAIVYHCVYYSDNRQMVEIGPGTGVGTIENPKAFKLASEKECENFYEALDKAGYIWDDVKLKLVKK